MKRFVLLLVLAIAGGRQDKSGHVQAWWPDGTLKRDATYAHGVLNGEYRTYHASGAPYELRHYVNGREVGLQQSWTADGELYLNYEMRNGRRFGLVNSKPCLTVSALLPFYDSADFTPHWTATSTHAIAPFSLVTQTGATLTRDDLIGRIHIASFMFTRCPTICPAVTSNLKKVQAAITDPDVLLVSYSVTPEVDPPDLLAAFGTSRGIDPSRWRLVTGDRCQIYALARESYFADDRRAAAPNEILHSEKVLLVDRDGHVRGVYNGTLPFEIEKLIEDVRTLQGSAS